MESLFQDTRRKLARHFVTRFRPAIDPKFVAWTMLLTSAGASVASLIGAGISNPWLLIPGVLFGAMFVCALVVTEDVVG